MINEMNVCLFEKKKEFWIRSVMEKSDDINSRQELTSKRIVHIIYHFQVVGSSNHDSKFHILCCGSGDHHGHSAITPIFRIRVPPV